MEKRKPKKQTNRHTEKNCKTEKREEVFNIRHYLAFLQISDIH